MSIRKKTLAMTAAVSALIFVILLALRGQWTVLGLSDAAAIVAIAFLIAALFWFVKYLRCFDLLTYGFRRFVELWKKDFDAKTSPLGSFQTYRQHIHHSTAFLELGITAAAWMIIALLTAFAV